MFFPHLQRFSCDFRGFFPRIPQDVTVRSRRCPATNGAGATPRAWCPASLSGRGRGRRARTGAFPRSDVRIIPLTMARYGIAYYNYNYILYIFILPINFDTTIENI